MKENKNILLKVRQHITDELRRPDYNCRGLLGKDYKDEFAEFVDELPW